MRFFPRADLRTLIVLLAVVSIVMTLTNALYATWHVQRMVSIDNTQEANRAYASKLASTTDLFFQLAQSQLRYSAEIMGENFSNIAFLRQEVERLHAQTTSFNSVVVADASGVVKSISPASLILPGTHLISDATQEALRLRQPTISSPTLSTALNLMIFVSWPIVDSHGNYLGFVGGTLYLKQKSVLNTLLGEQYYRDGTSVYVLDSSGQVFSHQNTQQAEKVLPLPLLSDLQGDAGESNGTLPLRQNPAYLAGYATVPTTGWTIVALKPTAITLEPLSGLLWKVLKQSVPFALLTLLVSVVMAWLIALPLRQLARKARQIDAAGVSHELTMIHAWYVEAAQVKRALLTGIGLVQDKIGRLKSEVQTDPLTQLLNRRGLRAALHFYQTIQQPFGVLAMDIDHFKRVNDSWGHDAGDEVIKMVADILQHNARQSDVICRNGGEEFLMLLPLTSEEETCQIAERIREVIADTAIPPVGYVTLSTGVAFWQPGVGSIEQSLKQADMALYQAKQSGRNCVRVADEKPLAKAKPPRGAAKS